MKEVGLFDMQAFEGKKRQLTVHPQRKIQSLCQGILFSAAKSIHILKEDHLPTKD